MPDYSEEKPIGPDSESAPDEVAAQVTAEDDAEQARAIDACHASDDAEPSVAEAKVESDAIDAASALEEAEQRVLRVQAELENYRKRSQRIMQEERRYAAMPLLRDLLAVWDNLQRAIEAAEQHENAGSLLEGVKMVAEQFSGVLKQHHCERIEAEGNPFDPNLHEAIAQFPSQEHEPGHVSQVTQVGYQLHDRVIRPSQVIIASAKPED